MRSGCAMVNTSRVLNQVATKPRKTTSSSSTNISAAPTSVSAEYPKPDLNSFAFTLAVGSQFAHLCINWDLEIDSKDSIQWHMQLMRAYSYHSPTDLNSLHLDMNNILDWGVGKRKAGVMEQCENIHEIRATQPKAKKHKTKDDADGGL